eukprot:5868772-Pyramimonas_sp.AAC.1
MHHLPTSTRPPATRSSLLRAILARRRDAPRCSPRGRRLHGLCHCAPVNFWPRLHRGPPRSS